MMFDEAERVSQALKTVAFVVATSCALAPSEAHAWDHSWKPRRHHRRMTERSINVKNFFEVFQAQFFPLQHPLGSSEAHLH